MIPFQKMKKKSSRGDFHSYINSSAGEFPMSAAIKACQIKYDMEARREKYSNHLSNLFPELPQREAPLSPLTALTINLCLTDYSINHFWPRRTCGSSQTQVGNRRAHVSRFPESTCCRGQDALPAAANHHKAGGWDGGSHTARIRWRLFKRWIRAGIYPSAASNLKNLQTEKLWILLLELFLTLNQRSGLNMHHFDQSCT